MESLFSRWGRITDIDDVICNVIGSIVGYFIYKITLMLASKFNFRVLNKTNPKGMELTEK